MPHKIYNWKRFWCPREGKLNLSDDGYLWDPDIESGSIYNPDVVPFESISKFPCLALLGEPGMGKSTAMQTQKGSALVSESGDASLWVDLRAFQTDVRLAQGIFEAPVFQDWLNGKHRLHLFLDSLDECLLRVDTVAALLTEEFGKCPIDRLYLRIACRTADWPGNLEEGIRRLWSEEAVKVYELTPLRRVDVVEAAKADGLNADNFLTEVDKREVIPLAIKPVTLRFLLNTYSRHGQFPSSQAELYLEGCRLLCEETSESRRAAQLTGTLSAHQRLVVAPRIAALTIFANRYAIWTSFDAGDVPVEDIKISDLYGGKESINGEEIAVTETAIREVLDTGLFSSRGTNRMGWAHQTYAEFLAARYLLQRRMTVAQIMSLIVHPGDAENRLVPQLHETAAWLAGMIPQVFREIIKTDPEVLLRSDVATADVKDRAALVDTLLNRYDEERLLDRDFGIYRRYAKLAYPKLAEQLEPFIRDRSKGLIVRRVAVGIAEACELLDLLPVLADLALDQSELLPVRENAAHAVEQIGDDATKARLKPLATGDAGDDPDDQLKGFGLRAVWPSSMSAKELFSVLTAPKRSHFFGAYHRFIVRELPKSLQPAHLPEALLWVGKQGGRHAIDYSFGKLVDAIVIMGWEHLDSPGVLEVFATAALSRIEQHESLVEDNRSLDARLRENHANRHRLLESMVAIQANSARDKTEIAYSRSPIVLSDDLPWMIERLHSSKIENAKQIWSRLISRSLDQGNPRQIDAVLVACDAEPILAEELRWLIKPVELGSPEAEKMKADYLEWQKWERTERDRPLLDPPPAKRIERLLDEYEAGDHSAWWKLNREMTLKPDSTHYLTHDEFEADLTILPGWEAAITATKRIVEAAKSFLLKHGPETDQWLGKNTIYRPAFAGYRAFRLLLGEDHDFISNLPAEVWRKWAAIILAYPDDNKEVQQELVKLAYRFAPDEIMQTLSVLIDKENNEMGHVSVTDKMQLCWDERLSSLLLVKVRDKSFKPESMRVLLENLIQHGVHEAELFTKSLLSLPLPSGGDERSRAIIAAIVLVAHAKDAGWSVAWPAIQNDPEFGTEIITAVARKESWGRVEGIWQKISEDKLTELFLWLARQYPYSQDPKRNGRQLGHLVTPRMNIADWRDAILHNLKMKGTRQACDAIRRISHELPELPWLKWTLIEAQTNARRNTWVPFKPADILTLAANQEVRVVQNGDQLLDVIIDSLKRLERKLRGETVIAQFLWEGTKDAPRPKDEASLCDFLKWQLEEDLRGRGIIINREVQIHRGERTDIYVNAVVLGQGKDPYESVTVIIEAKGCWHPAIDHAMETQLLGHYLKDNHCQHGFYLVGWFNCNLWDDNDYRKKQAPKSTPEEVQSKFEAQAHELSKQGKLIKALVINTALC